MVNKSITVYGVHHQMNGSTNNLILINTEYWERAGQGGNIKHTTKRGCIRKYRVNPKYSRNPNFCVACFELIISKIFATASKMDKKYFVFAILSAEPIFA